MQTLCVKDRGRALWPMHPWLGTSAAASKLARMPSTITIAEEIRRAAARLDRARVTFGHGTDNAWDDAAALVLYAAGLPLTSGSSVYGEAVDGAVRRRIAALLRQRTTKRVPTPYLIGMTYFAGLPMRVDRRALIPRSPIAELIESRFRPWVTPGRVRRILDIGTGGGCIAVACAHYFPKAIVVATDISTPALKLAAVNAKALRVASRVKLRRADLFPRPADGPFDVIVSNPPYVGRREYRSLAKEYRHEPAKALLSGDNGLDAVRGILARARTFLTRAGILVVEVGNSELALEQAYPGVPFLWLGFARGGGGVFLFRRSDLERYAPAFD